MSANVSADSHGVEPDDWFMGLDDLTSARREVRLARREQLGGGEPVYRTLDGMWSGATAAAWHTRAAAAADLHPGAMVVYSDQVDAGAGRADAVRAGWWLSAVFSDDLAGDGAVLLLGGVTVPIRRLRVVDSAPQFDLGVRSPADAHFCHPEYWWVASDDEEPGAPLDGAYLAQVALAARPPDRPGQPGDFVLGRGGLVQRWRVWQTRPAVATDLRPGVWGAVCDDTTTESVPPFDQRAAVARTWVVGVMEPGWDGRRLLIAGRYTVDLTALRVAI